ncbi:hypothetical protein F5Y09DRAFT_341030 [Xylaria sp. FL1042]|nr:hypothetical protein F5Y09DRAFT_341030 [Xylaria sp. FL1042]
MVSSVRVLDFHACKLSQRSESQHIVVKVGDVFNQPFAGTSSNCASCPQYHFLEPQFPAIPLGKHSFDLWASEEAEGDSFREVTGYRAQSSFGINLGSGLGLDGVPDWVKMDSNWDINKGILGARTATVLCTVIPSSSRDHNDSLHPATSSLRSLDPIVFDTLFPSSPIELQWNTDVGDWACWKPQCLTIQAKTAFVSFANIVGEKMEFAGRNDGTIWACGPRNSTANLPPPGHQEEPDEIVIDELAGYARKWIDCQCNCISGENHHDDHNSTELIGEGRAFRPATPSGLPIIDKVCPPDLTAKTSNGNTSLARESSSVCLCDG